MAENFSSSSTQKRNWEESEECLATDSVPRNSSNIQDEVVSNKKPRVVSEGGNESKKSSDGAQVSTQVTRTSSTEGYDSGVNGLDADDVKDEAETSRDAPDSSAGGNSSPSAAAADNMGPPDGYVESDDDSCSALSDLSGMSSEGWRPTSGAMMWVHRQMEAGVNPRELLKRLLPDEMIIPDDIDDLMLWRAVMEIVTEPPRRKKLRDVNTMDDVIHLLEISDRIMVLTGAGVSVSCGIPDFRSKDGIYSRLAVEYPDLPDPQAMFDIQYFKRNQGPFFKFAKEIYPGQFEPSLAHKFVRKIEAHKKLLRNYTQNIDTLEQVAHIEKVVQCHGSFAKATCMVCKYKTDAEGIKQDIMDQVIPRCPKCPSDEPLAIMKPDIVFFGESLPEEFHRQMELDKDECDLLIVMGSSLKVRPVALIPNSLPASIPQILINREPLKHLNFDVELLGNCDVIVSELCRRLGNKWSDICPGGDVTQISKEITRDEMLTPVHSGDESSPSRDDVTSQRTDMTSQVCADAAHSSTGLNSDVSSGSDKKRLSTSVDKDSSTSNQEKQTTECSSVPQSKAQNSVTRDSSTAPNTECAPNRECAQKSEHNSARDNEIVQKSKTISCQKSERLSAITSDGSQKSEQQETANSLSSQKSDQSSSSSTGAEQPSSSSSSADEHPDVRDSHERDDADLARMRASWKPRLINLASRLPENSHLFLEPNRYVFPGAEVYDDMDNDSDSSDSDMSDETGVEDEIGQDEMSEGNSSPSNQDELPAVPEDQAEMGHIPNSQSEMLTPPDSLSESNPETPPRCENDTETPRTGEAGTEGQKIGAKISDNSSKAKESLTDNLLPSSGNHTKT